MATVRELVTKLGFQADTQQAQKYDQALADVKRTARQVATAVAAVGTAATGLVWQFTQASSETLSWANRLGVATGELQRLQFAASKYQITNEAVTDGLKELSLRTDEFIKEGAGQAVEVYDRLGLSAERLQEVSGDTAELFRLVQSRIREVDNAAARQRIADELFGGQAGEQFAEFLGISGDELDRLGDLADRTGAVVPRETLERAREFSRETSTLWAIVRGFGKTLAATMLPAYREMVSTTKAWFLANREIVQQKMQRVLDGIGFALRIVTGAIGGFVRIVNTLAEAMGGWERVIRLVAIALTTLTGIRLAKWLWRASGALYGVAGALRVVRNLLGIGLLVTAIEDIWNWVNANDSAIGSVIGSWQNFKRNWDALWNDLKNNPGQVFDAVAAMAWDATAAIGDALKGIAWSVGQAMWDALVASIPDWVWDVVARARDEGQSLQDMDRAGGPALGGGMVDPAGDMQRGSHQGVTVNARTEAVLQLPQGTPEEQRQVAEAEVEKIFAEHWSREVRRALWDFQPAD